MLENYFYDWLVKEIYITQHQITTLIAFEDGANIILWPHKQADRELMSLSEEKKKLNELLRILGEYLFWKTNFRYCEIKDTDRIRKILRKLDEESIGLMFKYIKE